MKLLQECTLTDKCSYLKGKEQTAHYKIVSECSSEYCTRLVQRGWRRFGKMFFRPICPDCHECQSVKIDVKNYKFSKSERRIIKKNIHISSIMQRPSLSYEHIDLFNKYHNYMCDKKGWDKNETNPKTYFTSFVDGHQEFGFEILFFYDEQLIAVDLIDIVEDGISSIYFYYDPDFAHLSLGKYSLFKQIELAEALNKLWIYLGYYVKDCESLNYKNLFQPQLSLQNRPTEFEEVVWQ